MTQLSLFDTPTASSNIAPLAVPSPVKHVPVKPVTKQGQSNTARVPQPNHQQPNHQADQNSADGVQRMGDLAKLVLMRYELAAQRNALMEKRTRAQKAK